MARAMQPLAPRKQQRAQDRICGPSQPAIEAFEKHGPGDDERCAELGKALGGLDYRRWAGWACLCAGEGAEVEDADGALTRIPPRPRRGGRHTTSTSHTATK